MNPTLMSVPFSDSGKRLPTSGDTVNTLSPFDDRTALKGNFSLKKN